jgi:ParB/RepB/Spo0J family partition protein
MSDKPTSVKDADSALVDVVHIVGQRPIPLASIQRDLENVRKTRVMAGLDELRESIVRLGLIQPVVVYQTGDKFQLVSGQRRYLACHALGWDEIPAVIISEPRPTARAVISLSENIQRRKLPLDDIVPAVSGLYDRYKGTPAAKVKRVVRDLGLPRSRVVKYLALRLVPPEVLQLVKPGGLTEQTAEMITAAFWPDTAKIRAIAHEAMRMTTAEWQRAVDAGIRNPDAKVSDILEFARKPPPRIELRIPVDPTTHEALRTVARRRGTDVVSLITGAIADLLEDERE